MTDGKTSLIKIAEPYVPTPVQTVTQIVWLFRQKRILEWWAAFVERAAIDPHEVEDEIYAAAAKGDERVVQAVMEGARAAADAVDPIVLPAMAIIGRSYSRGDMPSWFHRSAMAFLGELSADEFGQVRVLLWELEKLADAAREEIKIVSSPHSSYVLIDENNQNAIPLTPVPNVRRLFSAIKRHSLGFDQGGGMGSAHPNVVIVDPRVLDWLRSAVPQLRVASE